MKLLLHWLLSALALMIVATIVPGFAVGGLGSALIAAVVIGLINATLGFVLKVVTFPLTILTLGLFWFVINAVMLLVASSLLGGFQVASFWSAFLGGIVLTLVNMVLKSVLLPKE